jgi:hypothetical protein
LMIRQAISPRLAIRIRLNMQSRESELLLLPLSALQQESQLRPRKTQTGRLRPHQPQRGPGRCSACGVSRKSHDAFIPSLSAIAGICSGLNRNIIILRIHLPH